MTKKQFYSDPDVQEMACWIAKHFESGLEHSYYDRKKKCNWNCNGLYDAFRKYEWKGADWENTKKKLDLFRHDLREVFKCKDPDQSRIVCVCEDILKWGGVTNGNKNYLKCRQDSIVPELQNMKGLLSNDETPSKKDMRTPSDDPCKKYLEYRMNAGFSKIYSLLCDYRVMYDSRVGAALCLLVRQFCEDKGYNKIPQNLKFALCPFKEAKNAKCPKNRNPSRGSLKFRRLYTPLPYTKQVMCASWLLRLALEKAPNDFTEEEEGFHELAAGLFMIGYDLGNP